MKVEYWRPVVGFEGLYEVSNYGNVRSLNYRGKKGVVNILSQRNHSKGYLTVCLRKNGKSFNRYVHRLAAEAFIPNPYGYKEIDHVDRNKTNNQVLNLRWVDRETNVSNSEQPNKRAVCQYDLEGNFISKYISIAEASLSTGVETGNIVSCCKGKYKQMNGFIWRYASSVSS